MELKTRGLAALGLLGLVATLIAAPNAAAATTNLCQLTATLDFSQPLKTSAADFAYTLSGRLESCRSDPNTTGLPAAGTIEAGKIYTAPNGKQYREPGLTGNGACTPLGLSQFKGGTLIVRWDGGGITLLPNGFSGPSPLLNVQGDATKATLTLQPVNPLDDPLVIATTKFAGQSSIGAAVLQYASPADCAGTGVKSATLTGVFGPYAFS